ncbi:hypothetical protein C8R47DRAFT_1077314 [Mycena vitilis]|nr:hypothetical protein C8R47DRAFT_1077314 [Mycena vitilis]
MSHVLETDHPPTFSFSPPLPCPSLLHNPFFAADFVPTPDIAFPRAASTCCRGNVLLVAEALRSGAENFCRRQANTAPDLTVLWVAAAFRWRVLRATEAPRSGAESPDNWNSGEVNLAAAPKSKFDFWASRERGSRTPSTHIISISSKLSPYFPHIDESFTISRESPNLLGSTRAGAPSHASWSILSPPNAKNSACGAIARDVFHGIANFFGLVAEMANFFGPRALYIQTPKIFLPAAHWLGCMRCEVRPDSKHFRLHFPCFPATERSVALMEQGHPEERKNAFSSRDPRINLQIFRAFIYTVANPHPSAISDSGLSRSILPSIHSFRSTLPFNPPPYPLFATSQPPSLPASQPPGEAIYLRFELRLVLRFGLNLGLGFGFALVLVLVFLGVLLHVILEFFLEEREEEREEREEREGEGEGEKDVGLGCFEVLCFEVLRMSGDLRGRSRSVLVEFLTGTSATPFGFWKGRLCTYGVIGGPGYGVDVNAGHTVPGVGVALIERGRYSEEIPPSWLPQLNA